MKKIIFSIGVVLIFLLAGCASAFSVINKENKIIGFESDNESNSSELKIPDQPDKGPLSKYDWRDYFHKYGIKIWAHGWGVVNSKSIQDNYDNHEFIVGISEDDDVYRVNIWAPEKQTDYYQSAPFNYQFYDDDAESRMNALITNIPLTVLLLDMLIQGFAEKFRRNSKMPFLGTGAHELRSGHFFNGTILKGMTYEGELRPPKMVDTDGDGEVDTEMYYYEVLAKVTYLFHVQENVDMSPWEFLKITLNRFLFWKDPDFIPYDI